ncbi:hypothetical protein [Streptomyces sp. NPDC096152]|uniref:hypothetical protein n=1 Tax=Streptomyces sp. NPDC096152 TaxID=3366078 RepID=UPI00380D9AC1
MDVWGTLLATIAGAVIALVGQQYAARWGRYSEAIERFVAASGNAVRRRLTQS